MVGSGRPTSCATDLAPLFADEAEVVTSCGSGTSAAHHILATRVAGLPDPILYVGSYSDWSRSGYPVSVGPEPGAPEEAWPATDRRYTPLTVRLLTPPVTSST